jgi:hypothetical protein
MTRTRLPAYAIAGPYWQTTAGLWPDKTASLRDSTTVRNILVTFFALNSLHPVVKCPIAEIDSDKRGQFAALFSVLCSVLRV